VEPPVGIEPRTFSLRVVRRRCRAVYAGCSTGVEPAASSADQCKLVYVNLVLLLARLLASNWRRVLHYESVMASLSPATTHDPERGMC
jgi:hypothetical protein